MTTRPTTSPAVRSASVSGGRQLVAVLVVAVAAFSCVVAACAWASDSTTSHAESFAKRVDIGGGRMMYIECAWQRITHRPAHLGYGHGV